jgi:hypothetical protein
VVPVAPPVVAPPEGAIAPPVLAGGVVVVAGGVVAVPVAAGGLVVVEGGVDELLPLSEQAPSARRATAPIESPSFFTFVSTPYRNNGADIAPTGRTPAFETLCPLNAAARGSFRSHSRVPENGA